MLDNDAVIERQLSDFSHQFMLDNNPHPDYDYILIVDIDKNVERFSPFDVRSDYVASLVSFAVFDPFFQHIDRDESGMIFELLSNLPYSKEHVDIVSSMADTDQCKMSSILDIVDLPLSSLYYVKILRSCMIDNTYTKSYWEKLNDKRQTDVLVQTVVDFEVVPPHLRGNQVGQGVVHSYRLSLIVEEMYYVIERLVQNNHCARLLNDEVYMQRYITKVVDLVCVLFDDGSIDSLERGRYLEKALAHLTYLFLFNYDKIDSVLKEEGLSKLYNKVYLESNVGESFMSQVSRSVDSWVDNNNRLIDKYMVFALPLFNLLKKAGSIKPVSFSQYYGLLCWLAVRFLKEKRRGVDELVKMIEVGLIWKSAQEYLTVEDLTDDKGVTAVYSLMNISFTNNCYIDQWSQSQPDLLISCINTGLIERGDNSQAGVACKSSESRLALLNFVKNMCVKVPTIRKPVLEYFSKLIRSNTDRSSALDSWTVEADQTVENVSDYVGIQNLGSTCYMNSVFQLLFNTEEWRDYIIELDLEAQVSEKQVLIEVRVDYCSGAKTHEQFEVREARTEHYLPICKHLQERGRIPDSVQHANGCRGVLQ